MTVVVGAIAILLSCLLGTGLVQVGEAVVERARAQAAADAAALAAVAEAALGGGGDPALEARRFARLNGASLARCLCEPGATAAQVEVSFGSASARARAAFDPDRLLPAVVDGRGLHPLLDAAVDRLLRAAHGRIVVVSGKRAPAEQATLWSEALRRHGSPEAADDWVARPGTSKHELGLAVDLGGDLQLAVELIERLGLPLVRPLPHEPWHFEFDHPLTSHRFAMGYL